MLWINLHEGSTAIIAQGSNNQTKPNQKNKKKLVFGSRCVGLAGDVDRMLLLLLFIAFIHRYFLLSSRLTAYMSHVILNEWLCPFIARIINIHGSGVLVALCGCCMAGATWNAAVSAQVLCTPFNHAPGYSGCHRKHLMWGSHPDVWFSPLTAGSIHGDGSCCWILSSSEQDTVCHLPRLWIGACYTVQKLLFQLSLTCYFS